MRFRLQTLLVLVAALAFVTEVSRLAVGGRVTGSLLTALVIMYAGAVPAILFPACGYAIGQRPGAMIASFTAFVAWLLPLWFFGVLQSSDDFRDVSGVYVFFVATVTALNIWNVWHVDADKGDCSTLDRLNEVKRRLSATRDRDYRKRHDG